MMTNAKLVRFVDGGRVAVVELRVDRAIYETAIELLGYRSPPPLEMTPITQSTFIDPWWSSWDDVAHYDIELNDIVFDDWREDDRDDGFSQSVAVARSGCSASRDAQGNWERWPSLNCVPLRRS